MLIAAVEDTLGDGEFNIIVKRKVLFFRKVILTDFAVPPKFLLSIGNSKILRCWKSIMRLTACSCIDPSLGDIE